MEPQNQRFPNNAITKKTNIRIKTSLSNYANVVVPFSQEGAQSTSAEQDHKYLYICVTFIYLYIYI